MSIKLQNISPVAFRGINSETSADKNTNLINSTQQDTVELSNLKKGQQKVTFKEGVKIFAKGFINKAKNMLTSIIKHPIKTVAAIGLTAIALNALPLIGITTATGASILAIGYAGIAVTKTIIDGVQVAKDNKAGNYDKMREDLGKLGGDGLDLALSLPFMPKAIKQVKRTMKYGKSAIGINKELISNLKSIKNIKDVPLEFTKADLKINYEMIANEMGLKVKPQIQFISDMNPMLGAAYEPVSGTMQINETYLTPKGKMLLKASKSDLETLIRHEMEHFKQFSDIVRSEEYGIAGFSEITKEYYKNFEKLISSTDELKNLGLNPDTYNKIINGDTSVINKEFYNKVIQENGIIPKGSKEAAMAKEYAQGFVSKSNPTTIENMNNAIVEAKRNAGNNKFKQNLEANKAMLKEYKKNILEKEAYEVQDEFRRSNIRMRPTITGDIVRNISLIETDKKDS